MQLSYRKKKMWNLVLAVSVIMSMMLSSFGGAVYAVEDSVPNEPEVSATAEVPQITKQPAGMTVNAGETATFTVTAAVYDEGTLSYQWHQSLDNGSIWDDIPGATDESYTTEELDTADSGNRYRCMVVNNINETTASAISDAATLTVNAESTTVESKEITAVEPTESYNINATINQGETTAISDGETSGNFKISDITIPEALSGAKILAGTDEISNGMTTPKTDDWRTWKLSNIPVAAPGEYEIKWNQRDMVNPERIDGTILTLTIDQVLPNPIIEAGTYDISKYGDMTEKLVVGNGTDELEDVILTGTNNTVQLLLKDKTTVTLKDVIIEHSSDGSDQDKTAITVAGTATIILEGTNSIQSGMNEAGINISSNAALNIQGTGTLNVTGGRNGGAGIGGDASSDETVAVTINGGTINATGGYNYGAGIGGDASSDETVVVTINEGTINAKGGYYYGVGIGGNVCGAGAMEVTINGGVVNATGGGNGGAGIGGNSSADGTGMVTINGGTITAAGGGNGGAGIGSSIRSADAIAVAITEGTITATGGKYGGAGIGGGAYGAGGTIKITGGTVKAINENGMAAGIGGGFAGDGGEVTICGGAKVYAEGAENESVSEDIGKGEQNLEQVNLSGSLSISDENTVVFTKSNKEPDYDSNNSSYSFTDTMNVISDKRTDLSLSGEPWINAQGMFFVETPLPNPIIEAGTYDLSQYGDMTEKLVVGNGTDELEDVILTGTNNTVQLLLKDKTTVTLQDVSIDQSSNNSRTAITVAGTATIILDGTNNVKSGFNKAGIMVDTGTSLAVQGTGTINVTGGENGAGIGGGENGDYESITITGGTVNAIGGTSGAGIGGGEDPNMDFGFEKTNITITGGTVKAIGGQDGGAGIGGGLEGDGGTIIISDGAKVYAEGYKAEGGTAADDIGKGSDGSKSGSLSISGAETKVFVSRSTESEYGDGNKILNDNIEFITDETEIDAAKAGIFDDEEAKGAYLAQTITTYTVTFNSNGGNNITSQSVVSGGKATKPTSPTKAGYTFDGWYKEQSFTNAWDFDTCTVTENITLYAKWKENAPAIHTITASAGTGGTISPSGDVAVTQGENVTFTITPNSGYKISDVKVDGGSIGAVTQYEFSNVTAAATIEAKFVSDTTGGSGGSSSGGRRRSKTPPKIKGETGSVSEDIGTVKDKIVDGIKKAIVKTDSKDVEKLIDKVKKSDTLTVQTGKENAVIEFTVKDVQGMQEKELILDVQTEKEKYIIDTTKIDIKDISGKIGEDVKLEDIPFSVEISKPDSQKVKVVENSAKESGLTIVVPSVNFKVTATYGKKNVEVKRYTGYVKRMVEIPKGVDVNKITTAIVTENDGSQRHVPTYVQEVDGKYYALINSLTNSTYTVIYNEKYYNDINGHWAEESILKLGSRLIFEDTKDFNPDSYVTRADMVKYLVKALGLKPDENLKHPFVDVDAADIPYVATAYEYGITGGVSEKEFAPDDFVTREQMMKFTESISNNIIQNSLKNKGKSLADYSDINMISAWAYDSVLWCIDTGIIAGKSNSSIAPQDKLTKAEIAAIIDRLLMLSDLID